MESITSAIISTEELLQINEAAKALKQKSFIIYNNCLVGCDNIDICIKFVKLPIIVSSILEGTRIITRELSAFIKNITIETEFIIETAGCDNYSISTMNNILIIMKSYFNMNDRFSVMNIMHNPISNLECINDKISKLFEMHKSDGCLYYIHQNKWYITLFPGLLPITKSDKIFLEIYESVDPKSFIASFIVQKKKYKIQIILRYLYL